MKNYKCQICGKEFKLSHHLQLHINGVHKGKKDHKCDQCKYASVQLSQLMKHKKLIHGNQEIEKNHKCNQCDKAFPSAPRYDFT